MIKTGVFEVVQRPGGMPAQGTHARHIFNPHEKTQRSDTEEDKLPFIAKSSQSWFPSSLCTEEENRNYSYSVLLALLIRVNIQHVIEIVFPSFLTLWCLKYNLDMPKLLKIAFDRKLKSWSPTDT